MNGNRRAIPAHCAMHGGTPAFTNLLMSKRDGTIVRRRVSARGAALRRICPARTATGPGSNLLAVLHPLGQLRWTPPRPGARTMERAADAAFSSLIN